MPRALLSLRRSAVTVAIAGLSANLAAQAQTAPPAQPTDTTLPTVTVRANADASAEGLSGSFTGGQVARGTRVGVLGNVDVMSAPLSTVGYTSELMQDQQARSVGDVLLNDASVRAARGFGNFQQVYYIRGLPVFSDDVAYNGLYGLVPRQSMATEFVERVEVVRGASAFIGGTGLGSAAGGGLGGYVNVVPKRAPNEPLNRVTIGAQTGGQWSFGADLARRFGPDQATGLRLNLARRDGGTGIDGERQSLDVAALGLDWRSRGVRLSADLGFQDNQLGAPRPSVSPGTGIALPVPPDARRNFAQPWTYSNGRDVFGTVRAEVDLTDNTVAWAAFGARQNDESNSVATTTLTSAAGDTSAYRFDNVRDQFVHTAETGVRGRFKTGSVGHEVSLSATLLKSRERNAYAFSDFAGFSGNLYNPVTVAPPAATFFVGGAIAAPNVIERISNSSVALADTLSFSDDTVRLTLGARQQSIATKGYDYNTGVQNASYDESRVSPMAGLLLRVAPGWSLYGNYVEGLVKGDTASGAGVINIGEVFAPYVSKQKEVGAKFEGDRMGATVALFSLRKPSAYVENNVYGVFGDQRHRGLEINVYGSPLRSLRLLGGLALLDARQMQTQGGANNGKRAIGVPAQQLNLGAEWDVDAVRGLTLDARVIRTGSQFADAANTQRLAAWTRLDLGARYLTDLGGRLVTLRGRIENVADKNHWTSAGGYPGQGYLVLGAPRTFVVSASVDF
jgi:iron complex outermembrane receptor protein